MSTETQYTVKVPLNPTGFPQTDRVVIWDESEGRFNISKGFDCQLQYIWSTNTISAPVPTQTLMLANGDFNNTSPSANFLGLSYTGFPGNDYKNYLSGITSAYFFITQHTDPEYYVAFQGNLLVQNNNQTVFKIVNSTFSSSDPNGLGTPTDGEILCVSIIPSASQNITGDTGCSNISAITIDFTSVTVGDVINFTLPPNLGLQTGDEIRIIYIPDPNVQVIGVIDAYDPTGSGPNTSVTIELIFNDGYTAGQVDETDTCYEVETNNSEFIFKRTLFVDMNGDDDVASNVSPIGGTLNPPFQTIQGAIDYITTNLTSFVGRDVTIHVFAGTYYVSHGSMGDTGPGPIELGYTTWPGSTIRVHLYLEDGVYIEDNSSSSGGTESSPVHLFKLEGPAPSISGYGVIKCAGSGYQNWCDVFKLVHPTSANIQLKRINHTFRYNHGRTFKHIKTQSKSTEVYFEGEIYIDNPAGGVLYNQDLVQSATYMSFQFGHNTKVTIKGTDSNEFIPVYYSGNSTLIIRGDWYHQPSAMETGRIFLFVDNQSVYIFDGADIYLQVTAFPTLKFFIDSITSGSMIEVRETTYSNGYVDNNPPITNNTGGFLFQGANIKPNILQEIY